MNKEEIMQMVAEAYLQGQKDLAGAIKQVLEQIESESSNKIILAAKQNIKGKE